MKLRTRFIALFFFILISSGDLNAQGFDPIDPCNDPSYPACPIDGGTALLIGAGIIFGYKKVKELHSKTE